MAVMRFKGHDDESRKPKEPVPGLIAMPEPDLRPWSFEKGPGYPLGERPMMVAEEGTVGPIPAESVPRPQHRTRERHR